MYEEFVAKRLAQLRQKKGVSARDMSLSIGQNVNYINHIENQKALPSMQGFFYICEYLDISPRDFFDDEKENPQLLKRALEVLQGLKNEEVTQLLSLAELLRKK